MDIEKLQQTVESVGCTLHKSTIAEVSEKAKECRKLMIANKSKEYEA